MNYYIISESEIEKNNINKNELIKIFDYISCDEIKEELIKFNYISTDFNDSQLNDLRKILWRTEDRTRILKIIEFFKKNNLLKEIF